ncbi:BlaI/MecI/CopY family transcriptional regulator [Longispora sp. K20-0274]|uniref:BlaI/MecI/CopY family transcriptional regulator n=1 Tax=Longispora sp. K20-0274 TaxID=3088255 RepID=UPI0039995951
MTTSGSRRPGRGQPRRAAGELESEALGALWAAAGPLTPAELQAALGDGLAYNTVHTILTRLMDKGLVERSTGDRRSRYSPVKNATQLAAERMREVLTTVGDRAEALQHFVTSLSPEDDRALRAALDRTDTSG